MHGCELSDTAGFGDALGMHDVQYLAIAEAVIGGNPARRVVRHEPCQFNIVFGQPVRDTPAPAVQFNAEHGHGTLVVRHRQRRLEAVIFHGLDLAGG